MMHILDFSTFHERRIFWRKFDSTAVKNATPSARKLYSYLLSLIGENIGSFWYTLFTLFEASPLKD